MDGRLLVVLAAVVLTQGGRPRFWLSGWRWPFEHPPLEARWPYVRRRLDEEPPPRPQERR